MASQLLKPNLYFKVMDYKELQELINSVASSGVAEVEIETKELKLKIRTQQRVKHVKGEQVITTVQQPLAQQVLPAVQNQTPPIPQIDALAKDADENTKYIKSPMVGTFYLKPAPDKPNFVNAGDQISPGQVICIIEAMKLFNEIEAEVSGKVIKVLVEDASPVEYDQPLFSIEP